MSCGILKALLLCVRNYSLVIHSLEMRPEDMGNSGPLELIPVMQPAALGEGERQTGTMPGEGDEASGKTSAALGRTSEGAEPSGQKAGNGSHPGMCREMPDISMSTFLGENILGAQNHM